MHDIILFVAAIIFVIVALPVLQTVADIVITFGQWIISFVNVKVTKNNVEVQNLNDSIQPTMTQAIGFSAPSEEDYYEDDNPDNNSEQKVGF